MAGRIEGERPQGERTPQQSKPTEQLKPHHEAGNSVPGLPLTLHERAKPPPEKSALNRAVERTRELYERNGWVFLPLGEVGKASPDVPTLQGEQQPHSGHEQQIADLDPDIEQLLQAASLGDSEYENSLREQYKNNPSFRESFDRFRPGGRGPATLTHSSPEFSQLSKNQEKQE